MQSGQRYGLSIARLIEPDQLLLGRFNDFVFISSQIFDPEYFHVIERLGMQIAGSITGRDNFADNAVASGTRSVTRFACLDIQ